MNDLRHDTLPSGLREAFERRAAEVPDGPVPTLGPTYGTPRATPTRGRRRAAVALVGAAAALLGAIAVVPIPRDEATLVASEPPPSPPVTTIWDWLAEGDTLVVAGSVGEAPWALVADDVGAVELRAEPRDGVFEGGFAGRFGDPPADGAPAFSQLGPCCRLGDHTLVASAVGPQVVEVAATPVNQAGDAATEQWAANALPDPRRPNGWRYVVIPIPADVAEVEISLTYDDGTIERLDDVIELAHIGG